MLLVFGFAASAFAIHAEIPSETQAVVAKGQTQITIGGEIRTRGEYRSNNGDFQDDGPAGDDHNAAWDQRVRLQIDAQVTPNTSGRIHLESVNNNLDSLSQDLYTWGSNTSRATGEYKAGNQKATSLNILEAWIQHKGSGLFGIPAGLKVGHMPVIQAMGLFYDHRKFGDDALLLFIEPMKNLEIGALTVKLAENNANFSDDADAYLFYAGYKDKEWNANLNVSYVNDSRFAGVAGRSADLWNFGLNGGVNISGIGFKGDINFQMGEDEAPDGRTTDFKGYGGMIGAFFTIAPVKISIDFAYGSGDSNATDDENKSFITSLGADPHFTYVYEYRTRNAANENFGGLTNAWYGKLGVNADLMKNLNMDLGLFYIQAVKKIDTNNPYGFANTTDSRSIGTELDAKFTYQIDRNLKYWVEGGYLFAGKFWKAVTGDANDPDDAYAIRHGIQLNF